MLRYSPGMAYSAPRRSLSSAKSPSQLPGLLLLSVFPIRVIYTRCTAIFGWLAYYRPKVSIGAESLNYRVAGFLSVEESFFADAAGGSCVPQSRQLIPGNTPVCRRRVLSLLLMVSCQTKPSCLRLHSRRLYFDTSVAASMGMEY